MSDIKKIGVAGSGTMGAGIAQILAQHGYKVVVSDLEEKFLEVGKRIIAINVEILKNQGLIKPEEIELVERNISFTTTKEEFRDCQLIIEAIVEKLDVKKAFWKEVEAIVARDCILASNTSGLSINAQSEELQYKDRFIGMHWWNPPNIIPLIELIKGDESSERTVEALENLIRKIGKQSVVVLKDAPGFIGNRLQFAVFREALHILEEGIATAEDIDKAMRFGPGFRYPHIGPLQTADLGGLDTFYYISSYLFAELSDIKDVPAILQDKMDKGELGTKAKRGFYDYPGDKVTEVISKRDEKFFEQLKISKDK